MFETCFYGKEYFENVVWFAQTVLINGRPMTCAMKGFEKDLVRPFLNATEAESYKEFTTCVSKNLTIWKRRFLKSFQQVNRKAQGLSFFKMR